MTHEIARVLLVEDNPGDARLIREMVAEARENCFELKHVSGLSEALKQVADGAVDVVLLDLSLPDSHGFVTFATLHARAPWVPIIVLSGHDDVEMAVKTVLAGAQDYLVKGEVDSKLVERSIRYAIERKQVAETLARERYFLRALIDNIPDSIYFKDAESRFVRINKAQANRFGLKDPDEATGKTDFDFFSEEHAAPAFADEQEVMKSRKPMVNKEEKETWPDGRTTWVSTTKMPLYDQNGKLIGTFGVSRDITDKKQAEQALAEERNVLRSLIDTSPDPIYVKDVESRFVLGNVSVARVMGAKTPEELIGKTDFDFYSEKLARGYRADEKQVIASGQPMLNREEVVVDAEGNRRWVCTSKVPLRNGDGEVVGLVGSGRDITDLKVVQDALAKERDLLQTLLDNSPDHIFFKDKESRFIRTNKAHALSLGLADPQHTVGKADFELLPREDAQRFYDEEQEILKTGRAVVGRECKVPDRKTGGVVWLSEHKIPIRGEGGQVVGLIGISRDITERKQAEQRVQRLNHLHAALLNPGSIEEKLQRITQDVVDIFHADFCRIWVTQPGDLCESGCIHAAVKEGPHVCRHRDRCLHLKASSGRYTHTDGQVHRRVPFGCYKIGRVASQQDRKFLTNDVTHDPRVHNHEWARELGLVSFAGYQLRPPDGETTGVMALFSRQPISPDEDALLENLANTTAQVIQVSLAETKLREKKDLLSLILSNIPHHVFWKDKNLVYLGCNENFARAAGLRSASEIVGKMDYDLAWKKEESDFYRECDREVINRGEAMLNIEEKQLRADGKEATVVTSKVPLRDSKSEVIGVLGIYADITERKRAEEELAEKVKELEAFNQVAVDREEKMIELKKEINALLAERGLEPRHEIGE